MLIFVLPRLDVGNIRHYWLSLSCRTYRVGKIRHLGCHCHCCLAAPYAWARLGTFGCHSFIHSFIHSVCYPGSLTKLARPLAKVVSYCSVVFWKKRTEQKATNIPKYKEKRFSVSIRYFQQRLKLFFTKKTRFRIKDMRGFCWKCSFYKVMTHFVNLGLIFVDRLYKNTTQPARSY